MIATLTNNLRLLIHKSYINFILYVYVTGHMAFDIKAY